jgi:hypothetical protein
MLLALILVYAGVPVSRSSSVILKMAGLHGCALTNYGRV